MKLPIGSGGIESLIRQVVNLRLKGTGKFWLLQSADNYVARSVPVGCGDMGMGKLLRHYLDGYALFSLTLVLLHPVALAIFESLFSALVALPTPDEH